MTSPEMHTLSGAYAVDALTEHERARFRRHLDECPACAVEVRELQGAAARLGGAAAEQPPAHLRERVLAQVRVTRQEPPSAGRESSSRARSATGFPRWLGALAVAAAVVGLALAGVFGGIAMHTNNKLEGTQQQMAQAREHYAPMAEILSAPDAHTMHGEASIGGGATVVASRSQDSVMFMPSELPTSSADQAYQVWLMGRDGTARSAGMVSDASGGMVMAHGISDAAGVGVTVEPAGGSPTGAPTTSPILKVSFPT